MVTLYEKVINSLPSTHMNEQNLLPRNMFGFRQGLSTQDVLLLLKEEVMNNIPQGGVYLVLALDLEGALK